MKRKSQVDEDTDNAPLMKTLAVDPGAPNDLDPEAGYQPPKLADYESDHDDSVDETNRRVFQVIAPADLRKGYRLNVIVTETKEEVVVRVPNRVKRSSIFQGKEARPVVGRWSDTEFDCCDANGMGGPFCCLAFFCTPLGWSIVFRRLGVGAEIYGAALPRRMPWLVGALMIWYCIMAPHPEVIVLSINLSIILIAFAAGTRAAVRKRYKIPGGLFEDFIVATFCSCCALMQSYRHMKRNGDTPACGGLTGVTIQV